MGHVYYWTTELIPTASHNPDVHTLRCRGARVRTWLVDCISLSRWDGYSPFHVYWWIMLKPLELCSLASLVIHSSLWHFIMRAFIDSSGVVRVMYLVRMAEMTSGNSFNFKSNTPEIGIHLKALEAENDLWKCNIA